MMWKPRDPFCFWCTVELPWWRAWLGATFCRDCMRHPGVHEFHSRVGMKER